MLLVLSLFQGNSIRFSANFMSLTGIAFIFKRFTGFYRVLGQCRRLRRPFIDISSVLLGFTEFFSHRLGFLWISPGRLESQSVFTGFLPSFKYTWFVWRICNFDPNCHSNRNWINISVYWVLPSFLVLFSATYRVLPDSVVFFCLILRSIVWKSEAFRAVRQRGGQYWFVDVDVVVVVVVGFRCGVIYCEKLC